MTAEPAFLIAAVRRFLKPETPLPNSQEIDWTALLRLADAHAVTPMLHQVLRDESIPERVANDLRSAVQRSMGWSLAQSGELVRLAGMMEEHGIVVVALKGPLLSRYLYGDLSVRSSGDIDVLVKREDVLRIRGVMASGGYRLATTTHWNADSACLRSREDEISFDSPSGVRVDLHWRLVPGYFPSAFDELNGWDSLTMMDLAGRPIRTLSPAPLLMFLCAHGAKHMFGRLGWICDIARFLMVTPNLPWSHILAVGGRTRSLRQLQLGITLAVDLLGAPSPADMPVGMRVDMPVDPAVQSLAGTIRTELLAGAFWPAPAAESMRQSLRLFETAGHRLRFLAGQYLTPSEAEYGVLQLPPWLYSLYYPLRPGRLIWKYAARSVFGHRV